MPYWSPDCRSYFSVRTGSVMESSKLPLRTWVWAVYLEVTRLRGQWEPRTSVISA